MAVIGGVKRIQVDDLSLKVGDTCTITKNNVTRESVLGLTGYAGTKENHRAARVEFQMLVDGAVKLDTLAGKTDATVSVITSGKTYVLRNACFVGDAELSAGDGTITLAFESAECREF